MLLFRLISFFGGHINIYRIRIRKMHIAVSDVVHRRFYK